MTMVESVTQEQMAEAIDWTSDCLGKSRGVKVSAETALKYVKANYPGGWEAFVAEGVSGAVQLKSEDFNPETLRVHDVVRHADGDHDTAIVVRFQAHPLVTVRWQNTGRESTENLYYLSKV